MPHGRGKRRRALRCERQQPGRDGGERYPQARKYRDFRKLYDEAKDIDAVVVSTCEHTHAYATLPALQLGKPVYCEKPLTLNVAEARIIREAAAKAKVADADGDADPRQPRTITASSS